MWNKEDGSVFEMWSLNVQSDQTESHEAGYQRPVGVGYSMDWDYSIDQL